MNTFLSHFNNAATNIQGQINGLNQFNQQVHSTGHNYAVEGQRDVSERNTTIINRIKCAATATGICATYAVGASIAATGAVISAPVLVGVTAIIISYDVATVSANAQDPIDHPTDYIRSMSILSNFPRANINKLRK